MGLRYLGKISGMSFSYIGYLERGVKFPSLTTAAKLARVLGYKIIVVKIKEEKRRRDY